MPEHEYTKEELINLYKDYFFENLPLSEKRIEPDYIGYYIMKDKYALYHGYDEKEGSSFFFQINVTADGFPKTEELQEIEPEKLAYMLSEPWGGPNITYEKQNWTYTSKNEWVICLRGKTLEELIMYYNYIIRETAGKVLDSYPEY